jgi:hypothetical protein
VIYTHGSGMEYKGRSGTVNNNIAIGKKLATEKTLYENRYKRSEIGPKKRRAASFAPCEARMEWTTDQMKDATTKIIVPVIIAYLF